jgi:hypothetical protein
VVPLAPRRVPTLFQLHLPRLEEQIIERLKERKFKMHGRQLFKVLRSEALARHPRLRDVIFRRFTFVRAVSQ